MFCGSYLYIRLSFVDLLTENRKRKKQHNEKHRKAVLHYKESGQINRKTEEKAAVPFRILCNMQIPGKETTAIAQKKKNP